MFGTEGLRQPAGRAGDGEDHVEVHGLRGADDVECPVHAEVDRPVAHSGEVCRGIAVAAVGLADDQRQGFALTAGEAVGEHAQRTIGDRRQALGLELVADFRQNVVVGGLAGEVVVGEGDVEERVDAVEVLAGVADERRPQIQGLLVAALELDDARPGAGGEGLVGVELRAGRLVEGVRVLGHFGGLIGVDADVEEVLDEHAEWCAPVADVVLTDDRVAEEFVGAGQGVADDGGAQVADVHLLGHVRRRVVDGHRL